MRSMLYIVTFLAVIAAAFWAYHENYKTQAALGEAQQLRGQIADARARLAVLNAEWAYLNRPDRLRDLVDVNFDRLGLMPLQPEQFGRVDQIAYPRPPRLDITDPVDVTSAGADE
ncbi:cell division protein FtsL [Marivita sp. GX14005]|uniref:cell division protein FtsL n=1 Tax=Marivita sp. GX14005 TaxID=2942276 RepID=UPI002019430E|nr:cell division protein FtsL [Marivita sp. GX14005]MCL3882327.1 cell division protein FtsL [Marivita sp. GX14005]